MSDPGLYTHLYTQLRDCAELIDDVIFSLETTAAAGPTKQRRVLSALLRALDKAPASDVGATLLWNVLRENKTQRRADWSEIADAIDRGDTSRDVIGGLEELARVLEVERVEMNARMRSSNAG